MKTKTTVIMLLIVLVLSSCTPAATLTSAGTTLPSAAVTASPTETLTPAPEKISEAQDLPVWVDEFVHAYGGKVTVNGVEMDAGQLIEEIRSHSDMFLQVKKVNGEEISFLVVNHTPLALREGNGDWQEASMARLSEMTGVIFEFAPRIPEDRVPQFISILKKVAGKNSRFIFPGEMDTCRIYNNFSTENWTAIISNWDAIEQDLNTGKVPEGYPYEWQGVYDIMNFVQQHVDTPQFRAQHVLEIRLNYCMLADSIINLWETGKFSQADMLKVLEFVVRTRVIQFPEITNWDVEDEMIAADVVYQTGGGNHYRFWLNATGKTPVELATLVAG